MKPSVPAFCIIALLLASPGLAQTVAPNVAGEIAAILQAGGMEQARDRAAYGTLSNPEVLAAKERQLAARMGRELAGIAAREASIDRNSGLQTAAYIARVAPPFGPAAYQAASNYAASGPALQPAAWYNAPIGYGPASPPIRPTTYVAGPSAGRPGQWYDSPYLARYGGAQPSGYQAANYQVPAPMAAMAPSFPSASATAAASSTDIWDPIEPVNRAIFAFNEVIDTFFLRPVAWLYSFTPDPVKTGVRNAFANLKSPAVLLNHTLQGNFSQAGTTVGRFAVNSTVGVLGFWDAADKLLDWKGKPADFGQTLHSYGVGEGHFLMLPLLGPVNTRDAIGGAADAFADPLMYILNDNANIALTAGRTLSRREQLLVPLDELRAGSVDYYATLRTASQQQRRGFLRGDAPPDAATTKATDDLFNTAQ